MKFRKQAEGSYFGDEEGFNEPVKQFSARVSSFDCTLLKISKKKIKQNAFYQPDLIKNLDFAGQSKQLLVEIKKEELSGFQNKLEAYRSKSNTKIEESRETIKKITEFQSKGKFHGINRESLTELAKQGKLSRFKLDNVPFHQKAEPERIKALEEVIESCKTLEKKEDRGSLSARRLVPAIKIDRDNVSKSSTDRLSSNLLLDKQQKMIRKLRNMSEKMSEQGSIEDLSRSYSKSKIETENSKYLFGMKSKITPKHIVVITKPSNDNGNRKVLTRAPTEEVLLPEKNRLSTRTIPDEIQKNKVPAHIQKMMDENMIIIKPEIIQQKLTPRLQIKILPKANPVTSAKMTND